ncbi:hypothetical protein DY000_02004595 [Brassica cretica]|uniref:Uncharacterized protein n=1 Tax=Brassica cretica TaxID=69181 RepID=A0ABQ7BXD0_BRACR|nr:hypothetical protein DY000_02004595 [Brassica cretica]
MAKKQGQVQSSSTTTKSAPLAGLLAHSAEAAGSQLISARQTVRVSGRWTESGSVVGCEVQPWGHGLLGLWTRPWAKSRRLGAWVGLELRMVLVKPRSREGSISERLCNVWLDDTRDELVIVYETVKKLCIGSHVSN